MPDERDALTKEDVIAYLGLKLDDPVKWEEIVALEKTEGSWVQQMIAEIRRKARFPFTEVDWMCVAKEGEKQSEDTEGSLTEDRLRHPSGSDSTKTEESARPAPRKGAAG